MIVVVVSECRRAARGRAASVVDRYLPRIGRRTWAGHLSDEGQRDLRKALRAVASRHMAVACHRVVGTHRTELLWAVGSRRPFDAAGAVCVSERAIAGRRARTLPERLLGAAVRLAALFHDLGKATRHFQEVRLRTKGAAGDPLRHELVSLFVVRALSVSCGTDAAALRLLAALEDGGNREGTAVRAEAAATLDRIFAEALAEAQALARAIAGGASAAATAVKTLFPLPQEETAPLLRTVGWLVATHHRLPRTNVNHKQRRFVATVEGHTHPDEATGRTPAGFAATAAPAPWREPTWTAGAAKAAADALAVLAEGDGEACRLPPGAVAAYGRLALLMGDHLISRDKTADPSVPPPAPAGEATRPPRGRAGAAKKAAVTWPRLYANTLDGLPAQPLADHLNQVARKAGDFLGTLLHGADGMPAIALDEVPAGVRNPDPGNPRFRWQAEAVAAIRERRDDGIRDGGFFGVVTAGTGTGKTVACAMIMTALSRRLRYTLALGLRSLTLQSGREYRGKIGFSGRDVAVVIGSELAALLHDLANPQGRDPGGTDADPLASAGDVVGVDDEFDDDMDRALPVIVAYLIGADRNRRRFQTAPVLVTTVDSLMAAADGRRGGHTLQALRAGTADLVLDEIDGYAPEDIVAIGRLVTLAASMGRRVVIASATITPSIAEALFLCYRAGWRDHAALTGKPEHPFAGWFSNLPGAIELHRIASADDFAAIHRRIAGTAIGALDGAPPARKAAVLDLCHLEDGRFATEDDAEKALFGTVLDGCRRLHAANAILDPKTGKRVSIGFVRWANVRPCRRFAAFAANAPAGGAAGGDPGADSGAGVPQCRETTVDHRVLCYHARHFAVTRFAIERFLDTALDRRAGDAAFLEHPDVRRHLDHTDADALMLIVSATPVEEAGRDHDFDWCVIDPSSTRSVVQSAGRVRRHRAGVPDGPNLLILSRPYRFWRNRWRGRGDAPVYAYPGVETPSRAPDAPRCVLPRREMEELFDVAGWDERVDARHLLDDARPLPDLATAEHRNLRDWLLDGTAGAAPVSARDFADGGILSRLTALHPDSRQFRRQAGQDVVFWKNGRFHDRSQWRRHIVRNGKEASNTASCETLVQDTPLVPDIRPRFILDLDDERLFADIAPLLFDLDEDPEKAAMMLLSVTISPWNDREASSIKIEFNPWLGGDLQDTVPNRRTGG